MADMNLLSDRCILTHECADIGSSDVSFITHPLARCAGSPSDDLLQLYPLCIDCDLLHQQGDRTLFSKLSALLTELHTDDCDRRKKAEEERELLRNQLHRTQKLDSIGQLAGGIAHEFNNILAAILGYAGILEMRLGNDSPNLTAVHRIISASERAASLTRGMLIFSRNQITALEQIPLNSFIIRMKERLCRLAGEEIQVDFHPDPKEMILNADVGQLQQLILNLFNNARDAMADGGRLTISTLSCRISGNEEGIPVGILPGNYALLTVTDTGHGIPPEKIDRIFDPFFTSREIGKGTGLGLSMVLGIVQQHEGFIKVSSVPGQVTTFSIWFPEFAAEDNSEGGRESIPPRDMEHCIETVLVGEDDEDVRLMIIELLQDMGYQVLDACDGAEVIDIMEDFGDTVDLLLLDVIMPRMNGFEALSFVRERYPDLPCLFLSGYSDGMLRQKANISGEFEYLSKPVQPDKLIASVRSALVRRGANITSREK
jgi:signal transduction histidine kinase/CheY-like chemotaxis protein